MVVVLFSIVLLSIFLSIDNIIPIVVISNQLQAKRERSIALFLGLLGGGVLRIILLFFAKALLQAGLIVYILAGIFLLYLGIKGIMMSENTTASERKSQGFLSVLLSIILVDLSLSIDNIAALVAITQDFGLLIIGVIISVILLFLLSFFINILLQKLQGLSTAAYLAIIFLGIKFLLLIGNIQIDNTKTSVIVILICVITVSVSYIRRKLKEVQKN